MKSLVVLSVLCTAALSAITNTPIIVESASSSSSITATPQSSTVTPGAVTVTIIPTQIVIGDATLTRNAPGTIIGDTLVSLGSDALVIGTSTIHFATSGSAPIYTVAGQTIAAGPAGVVIAGTTISNNGPAVTLSGTPVSLGSFGLVINDASTFAIPTVQPLQSVFAVGNESVTEQYGRIVFTSTQAVANSSVAATGTAAGPMPISSAPLFMGTAVRTKSGFGLAVGVFCASVFVIMCR